MFDLCTIHNFCEVVLDSFVASAFWPERELFRQGRNMLQQDRPRRDGPRKQVSFPATTAGTVIVEPAVAAIEPAVAEIEPAVAAFEAGSDAGSSIADDQATSVVGDSVGGDSDGDLPRQQRFAPPSRVQGEPEPSRGKSSKFNEEQEVGNFGIF